MTFRRSFKYKWFWPFILSAFVWAGYVAITNGHLYARRNNPIGILLGVVLVLWVSVATMRLIFASKIVVDDQGVRWKEGRDEGDLKWGEISKLVQEGTSVGLVERASGRPIKLPFVNRGLYGALVQRLNRLKPEEEAILFP